MGNVTLPTTVLAAGAGVCVVAGILVGSIAFGPPHDLTTAQVASFDAATSRLCLEGEAARDQKGADSAGQLCGTWRTGDAHVRVGAKFRFVSVFTTGVSGGQQHQQVVIYGNVLD